MVTEPRFIIRRTAPWLGDGCEWLVEVGPTEHGFWGDHIQDAVKLDEVEAVAFMMRVEDYAQRAHIGLSMVRVTK